MSYLDRQSGVAGFSKATVSFWFRVPKGSAEAAKRDWNSGRPDLPGFNIDYILMGAIPMISWGTASLLKIYQMVPYELWSSAKVGPSFIAVQFGEEDETDDVHLALRFQSENLGYVRDTTGPLAGLDSSTGVDTFAVGFQASSNHYGTATPITRAQRVIVISPDVWHHLIVSFDVSMGIKGNLWLSVDDVNYDGLFFYPSGEVARSYVGDGGGGGDPHGLMTLYSLFPAGDTGGQYTTGFDAITAPFGTPVPQNFNIYNVPVELAELQIFVGQTIDTNIEANRRAFVDKDGLPSIPDKAERLMGKRPEFLLHGSSNWIRGRNTGSLGLKKSLDPEVPDEIIPSGQFTPAGKIDPYSPNPNLRGFPQQPSAMAVNRPR